MIGDQDSDSVGSRSLSCSGRQELILLLVLDSADDFRLWRRSADYGEPDCLHSFCLYPGRNHSPAPEARSTTGMDTAKGASFQTRRLARTEQRASCYSNSGGTCGGNPDLAAVDAVDDIVAVLTTRHSLSLYVTNPDLSI